MPALPTPEPVPEEPELFLDLPREALVSSRAAVVARRLTAEASGSVYPSVSK